MVEISIVVRALIPHIICCVAARYANPRKTSSLCPRCGFESYPNGQRLVKCRSCGVVFDRDVVATLNLYKSERGGFRCPRTLPDEVRLIRPNRRGLLKAVEYS